MAPLDNGKRTSPDRIFLFPHSFPGELHASQSGQLHCESGNVSTQNTFSVAYGARPFLLRHNTLYPLFEIFGNARYDTESDPKALRTQASRMQKRVVGESGSSRLCSEC